ncbi:hypothetical protein DPMN_011073 [Dreissena polymorpha]|uniref:Uncharacterized protein n=1 Tax=Dreissena polymorpha TaxID=45954 RepID=A0A9D4N120_DREPO|nr:hypothetical protein DPMN_011073 [Dreissena polymorpha]
MSAKQFDVNKLLSLFSGTDPGPDPKDARLKELETQVNDLASNYSSLQQEYQRLLEENRTLKQELGEKKSHIQI